MGSLPLLLSLTGWAASSSVVVLDTEPATEEAALADELMLSGIDAAVQDAPPGFERASGTARLDLLRPVADGAAFLWIDSDPERLVLTLAVLSEARADVRVFESPRGPDALPRLALSARTALQVDAPPPPPREEVPSPSPDRPPVFITAAAGLTVPLQTRALGPRADLEVELFRALGSQDRLELGGALGGQIGSRSGRFTARSLARYGPVGLGLGADVAVLPWITWVQPRLSVGVRLPLTPSVFTEVRLRLSPRRDRVEEAGERLYDSGWTELAIRFGGQRQISGASRQPPS